MKMNMRKQGELGGKEEGGNIGGGTRTVRKQLRTEERPGAARSTRKVEKAYVKVRIEVANTIKWTKRQRTKKELDEIENDFRNNNSTDFSGKFKRLLTGYKDRGLFYETRNGLSCKRK